MPFMRIVFVAGLAFLAAACATAPAPTPGPAPAPGGERGLARSAAAAPRIVEPAIRVGLLTDQQTATFPRVDGGYVLAADGEAWTLRRGFTATAPRAGEPVRWAVRVATLPTREEAETEAQRVRGMTGAPVDVVEDASGKWRVLAGDFESEEAGRPTRDEILTAGYPPPLWIVRRPADVAFPGELRLEDDEGETYTIEEQSVLVVPASAETIEIGGKPYRGGAVLHINDRGLLNVINEVNLDDYVKGVVPGELGPRTYPEIEALKAQAVAARTYAARRLGEFASEGYDICPTPACQVYPGFTAEDPLSNQAVDETAGLVMTYDGRPIDALFTSTCGGATSDVSTMFPGRDDPYLRAASCVELETVPFTGRRDGEVVGEVAALATIYAALAGLPMEGEWGRREVVAAVAAANRLLGWTPDESVPSPATARRGDVLGYIARMWGLAATGRVLTLPEDRVYFFGEGQADDPLAAAQAFLIKYGVVPAQASEGAELEETMPRDALYALLLSWLDEAGALDDLEARVTAIDGTTLELAAAGGPRRFVVPAGTPLFRRFRERFREEARVPVMVSDRARIFADAEGRVVAAVIEANYDGASFDRTSGFANWTRSYTAGELVEFIAERVPIEELHGLRPLETDASHRVKRLEVAAEGGRTFVLEGIQIRFALELPDNLFTIMRTEDPDGMDRYTFFGKGWGHGTGMCQVGAYGMAFRGRTYDEILRNYYSGIEIVPVTSIR